MGTSLIDRLVAAGTSLTGAIYRPLAGSYGGVAKPLNANRYGELLASPPESLISPFDRLKVSRPFTLIDARQPFNANPLEFVTSLTGAGSSTYLPNEASSLMTVTTAAGDKVIRQTKDYARYQGARGLEIFATGVMGAPKANVRQRIGYFDDNNGIFFEQTIAGLSVVRRTYTSGAAVDNPVPRASWNVDKLDGTGPSGYTLDTSKGNIFFIDLEWLGMGRVRTGVSINGRTIVCHEFLNANNLTTVYMTSPSLPIRWSIENTGISASNTSMLQTCGSVLSQGSTESLGQSFAVQNGTGVTGVTVGGGVRTPVLSVRALAANPRLRLVPTYVSGVSGSNVRALIEIVIGGTLTGATFAATVGGGSLCEYDTAATAITGGAVVFSIVGGLSATGSMQGTTVESLIVAGADFAGTTRQPITVVMTTSGNANNTVTALNWREVY